MDQPNSSAAVRLQPSAPELKLHHLGKGDRGLLTSSRIEAYLDWLEGEDLLVTIRRSFCSDHLAGPGIRRRR
jgi:hypothetical protein